MMQAWKYSLRHSVPFFFSVPGGGQPALLDATLSALLLRATSITALFLVSLGIVGFFRDYLAGGTSCPLRCGYSWLSPELLVQGSHPICRLAWCPHSLFARLERSGSDKGKFGILSGLLLLSGVATADASLNVAHPEELRERTAGS